MPGCALQLIPSIGDCLQVKDLMHVLQKPFEEQPGAEKYRVAAPKEVRMGVELLSCSS